MKTKILFTAMLFYGLMATGFAQNEGTNPALERIFRNINGVEYSYSAEIQGYKVDYCRVSSCARFFIQYKEQNRQSFLMFISYLGSLANENQQIYKKINDLNNRTGLGSIVVSEGGEVCWYYVMFGMDRASIEYYLDSVCQNQSAFSNELIDYLKK